MLSLEANSVRHEDLIIYKPSVNVQIRGTFNHSDAQETIDLLVPVPGDDIKLLLLQFYPELEYDSFVLRREHPTTKQLEVISMIEDDIENGDVFVMTNLSSPLSKVLVKRFQLWSPPRVLRDLTIETVVHSANKPIAVPVNGLFQVAIDASLAVALGISMKIVVTSQADGKEMANNWFTTTAATTTPSNGSGIYYFRTDWAPGDSYSFCVLDENNPAEKFLQVELTTVDC
jgi:hypothetical protein